MRVGEAFAAFMEALCELSPIKRTPTVSHYTTDGGVLAPYPGMTDDDLRDFEACFGIPSSFKPPESAA